MMTLVVTLMSEEQATALRRQPLTYVGIGGTLSDTVPPGYHSFARSQVVTNTRFEDAVERLLTWRIHEHAGLRVLASAPRAGKDEVVEMRLGVGGVSLRIPCRVVHAVDGPDAAGFVYGTLPGHPESGEELFLIERERDGVRFTIRAFSRPGSSLARIAGPLGRRIQHQMTSRYLAAVSDP